MNKINLVGFAINWTLPTSKGTDCVCMTCLPNIAAQFTTPDVWTPLFDNDKDQDIGCAYCGENMTG